MNPTLHASLVFCGVFVAATLFTVATGKAISAVFMIVVGLYAATVSICYGFEWIAKRNESR